LPVALSNKSVSYYSTLQNLHRMAWLSVGISNEDLCAKMVENGVLREGALLDAFRFTDRGDFVEEEDRYCIAHALRTLILIEFIFINVVQTSSIRR
jgi:hypothetical protein